MDLRYLRYIGFSQVGNIREYTVHSVVPGKETRVFVVSADVELFLKHHVRLQEGPVLSLRKLTAEMEAGGVTEEPLYRTALTEQDMLAFLADLALHHPKRQSPRRRGAPSTRSSLPWSAGAATFSSPPPARTHGRSVASPAGSTIVGLGVKRLEIQR